MPDNLTIRPHLTPRQASVVGALLNPHLGIDDLIDRLEMQPAEFFDLAAAPEVQAHLESIRKTLDDRVRLRLSAAAHKAVDTLDEINESPTPAGKCAPVHDRGDPAWQTERRRAATTILRAHAGPTTRRPVPNPDRQGADPTAHATTPSPSRGALDTALQATNAPAALEQ